MSFVGRNPKPQALLEMEDRHLDPAETGEGIEELFLSSLSTLRSAQSVAVAQIKTEKDQSQVPLADLIKAQKDLAAILDMALKMEQRIDERNRRENGNEGTGDADVDLDAARYEIGCRLDRLRACCYSD